MALVFRNLPSNLHQAEGSNGSEAVSRDGPFPTRSGIPRSSA